jgi:hypothetical protein
MRSTKKERSMGGTLDGSGSLGVVVEEEGTVQAGIHMLHQGNEISAGEFKAAWELIQQLPDAVHKLQKV